MEKGLNSCYFCGILTNKKDVIYDGEHICVIDCKSKWATIHYLIIDKYHTLQYDVLTHRKALKETQTALRELLPNGWRIIINYGQDGNQTEDHWHVHVFGGEILKRLGV